MNCAACARQIGRREPVVSWRDRQGKKHYGCKDCGQSGKFAAWVDQQPPTPQLPDHDYVHMRATIRPDQLEALREEEERRTGRTKARGRQGKTSLLVREALDLWIEYIRHREFVREKVQKER